MKKLYFILFVTLGSCQIILYEEPSYYDNRDELVGRYELDEYSETTEHFYTYRIDILKSCCDSQEVLIQNFYDVGLEVTAYYDGYKLNIPRQYIGDYEIEGTGRFSGSELSISYVVRNRYQNPSTDFLNFTAWRAGY
jgi:hypothetical protein